MARQIRASEARNLVGYVVDFSFAMKAVTLDKNMLVSKAIAAPEGGAAPLNMPSSHCTAVGLPPLIVS
jgi:hypothetical protein